MNILVGVDAAGHAPDTIAFLARLVESAHLHLVHVVQTVVMDNNIPTVGPTHPLVQMFEQMEGEGRVALQEAKKAAQAHGFEFTSHLMRGDASHELVEYADKYAIDLVAVKSEIKSYSASLFFGSVAKGLLVGSRASVLILKGDPKSGPLDAVFATDHSPYADRCADKLKRWRLKLASLDVVVADELATGFLSRFGSKEYKDEVRQQWEAQNAAAVAKLADTADSVNSHVLAGHPNDVLREQMESSGADLLIMGAQGRGYVERLMIGSKSFHQVVSEHYPVLVMRD